VRGPVEFADVGARRRNAFAEPMMSAPLTAASASAFLQVLHDRRAQRVAQAVHRRIVSA